MSRIKTVSSLLLLACGALATRAVAQQDIHTNTGGSVGAEFGSCVCVVGDVNLDGSADIAVGIPNYDEGAANRGRVQVYSGATGALLWSNSGTAAGDQFGFSIVGVADVNLDGRADVAVGAPFADPSGLSSAGQVEVLSGSNGANLLTLNGSNASDQFGRSLGFGGTVSGVRRLLVGAPYKDNGGSARGSAFLYSLPSGTLLREWTGTQNDEHLGWSVSGGFDMTGDGVADVIVGAPDYDDGGSNTGRVRTYSGASPYSTLETLPGAGPGHKYGYSVAALQNVNNDGIGDFVVGAPDFNGTAGAIYIHSGAAFHPILYTRLGSTGEHMGTSVASAGDPNNDTRTDVVAGAPNGGTLDTGLVRVYSGLNGNTLATINGTSTFGNFGISVSGNGDFNGDNREDIIVGAPNGISPGASGSARAFTGLNFTSLFTISGTTYGDELGTAVAGIGDVNGDGRADYLVGSPKDDSTTNIFGVIVLNENVGSVKCISGANGAVLWTIYGGTEGDLLGTSIASLGDVNNDGKQDFVVGAPQSWTTATEPGYVRICSGANGATLFQVDGGIFDSDAGEVVANVGDITGDGKNDAGVGVPDYDSGRGRIFVVNSATGAVSAFAGMFGTQAGERFGDAIGWAGDRNGDGRADILVGAPSNDAVGTNAGRVYCISGVTPSTQLFALSGAQAGDFFGSAVCSMSDYDNDGKREYVVGASGADYIPNGWTDAGFVRMYLSASLTDVWTVYGGGSTVYLGSTLASIGDYTQDGFEDIIAGATEANLLFPGQGFVKVISGILGVEKYQFDGQASADFFGSAISGGGDVNADGTIDIIVGAPFWDGTTNSQGLVKSISLKPASVTYYGTSSPSCSAPQVLKVAQPPKIGTYYFEWGVNNVPPGLGLLLVTNAIGDGSDPFGIGVGLWVSLFTTEVYGIDIQGYPQSNGGFTYTPLPNSAPLVGQTFYGQTLWAWSSCSLPPYNLSTSSAVAITLTN
ncbi:MAG: FG-GAP repeat protein [Planctomycetes bacterium]|nr:FG-GAP repeat protein [Planctomycetota bacterium]